MVCLLVNEHLKWYGMSLGIQAKRCCLSKMKMLGMRRERERNVFNHQYVEAHIAVCVSQEAGLCNGVIIVFCLLVRTNVM